MPRIRTSSPTASKRERLTEAAVQLFQRHSYESVSIAQIAEGADVPLGNVYYYFRSKEAIAEAVLLYHLETVRQWLASLDQRGGSPEEKLTLWVDGYASRCNDLMQLGCPFGQLLLEFKRDSGKLSALVRQLFAELGDWLQAQYAAAGLDQPARRAASMLARTQGVALLALASEERALVDDQFAHLKRHVLDP